MKYMLMMFGDGHAMVQEHTAEWVAEMIEFMHTFNAEVAEHGELVEARGLADPAKARTVRLADGRVTVADEPFAAPELSLAGFWVVNVEDEDRAIELAGKVAVWAGSVEIREVPDPPPRR